MSVANFLKLRCPVCGKGKIFQGYLDTPTQCPSCRFYFMRETGYWLPHAPISYLVFVLSALTAWVVLTYVLAAESDLLVLPAMLLWALAVTIWTNRYTKMIWLLIDLTLHPVRSEDFESRGRGR